MSSMGELLREQRSETEEVRHYRRLGWPWERIAQLFNTTEFKLRCRLEPGYRESRLKQVHAWNARCHNGEPKTREQINHDHHVVFEKWRRKPHVYGENLKTRLYKTDFVPR